MLSSHSLPETQAALALSIFFATFIYEDGATLLAATLSAGGSLDPRIGILTTFLGIWVGDMGLYGLGSSVGRRTAQSRWLQKYVRPESLAKAEGWFARHGSLALVMSRAIPGSRLPLYVAAGALRRTVRNRCADAQQRRMGCCAARRDRFCWQGDPSDRRRTIPAGGLQPYRRSRPCGWRCA